MFPFTSAPAKRGEASSEVLRRLKQNDPSLKRLAVIDAATSCTETEPAFYCSTDDGLARLGDAIGENTNIRELTVRNHQAWTASASGAFLAGLGRNGSIRRLVVEDVSRGISRDFLCEFVANSSQLESINFSNCDVDDDVLRKFVSAIKGSHRLSAIGLAGNIFGRPGCDALASLLRGTLVNLQFLDLYQNNGIHSDCATVLANSLKGNRKLKSFNLYRNRITSRGWDAFSNALCDTSSVNETYLSNHTVQYLGKSSALPADLAFLLQANCDLDKERVAVRKILVHHEHLDMEPFYRGWDVKLLPHAVKWFDRAESYSFPSSNTKTRKLSSIYEFARALPVMFVPSNRKETNARSMMSENK